MGLATDADDSDGSIITGPSTSTPAAKRRRFVHHANPLDIISCTCCDEECTKLISYRDIQCTQEATEHLGEAEVIMKNQSLKRIDDRAYYFQSLQNTRAREILCQKEEPLGPFYGDVYFSPESMNVENF